MARPVSSVRLPFSVLSCASARDNASRDVIMPAFGGGAASGTATAQYGDTNATPRPPTSVYNFDYSKPARQPGAATTATARDPVRGMEGPS